MDLCPFDLTLIIMIDSPSLIQSLLMIDSFCMIHSYPISDLVNTNSFAYPDLLKTFDSFFTAKLFIEPGSFIWSNWFRIIGSFVSND